VTTTVRSVRVELEMGIAGYVANARIAGHETDKAFGGAEERISATSQAVSRLERNTGNLAKTSTEARVQQSSLGRDIDRTGASAGRAERSIDKYSVAGSAPRRPAPRRVAERALTSTPAGSSAPPPSGSAPGRSPWSPQVSPGSVQEPRASVSRSSRCRASTRP
jgi:hypothetical protein